MDYGLMEHCRKPRTMASACPEKALQSGFLNLQKLDPRLQLARVIKHLGSNPRAFINGARGGTKTKEFCQELWEADG
jgi:hypothetical protein